MQQRPTAKSHRRLILCNVEDEKTDRKQRSCHSPLRETVHDLKNLLLGMDLLLRSALEETASDQPILGNLVRIQSACRQGSDLCQRLLAKRDSDDGPGGMQRLDLCRLLKDLQPLLRGVIPETATLRYESDRETIWIEGNEAELDRALLNLVKNAGEALSDGVGMVTVRCGVTEVAAAAGQQSRRQSAFRPGQYAYLEVADTGCGMAKTIVARLFDGRFSTKTAGQGLGLLSVQNVAAEHRGMIEICSEPEVGTTFRVLFPVLGRPRAGTPSRAARVRIDSQGCSLSR